MRIGSLFSGYGGLDLAVMSVLGGSVAWHCDNDPAAQAVLAARWPGVPNLGDITAVDWSRVEPVDLITGGFPCQDISNAGKREGITGEHSGLWSHMAGAIRVLRPRYVVAENVAALAVRGLDVVLGDLAELGFDAEWTTLRASDVGAPHRRERLFVVATDPPCEGLETGRQGRTRRTSAVADTECNGSQGVRVDADARPRRETAAAFGRGPAGGGRAAADTARDGRYEGRTEPAREFGGPDVAERGALDWGRYGPAVRRWERVTGRPAPDPTEPGRNGERLSPRFVEWVMGLPAGWVTDVPGVSRNAALRLLGNGVVPQQATAAISHLMDREAVAA